MKLFTLDLVAGWEQRTATQLADMLAAHNAISPTGLTDAFEAVSAYGADESEKGLIFVDLLKVYGLPSSRFMDDLQAALRDGNLRKVAVHAKIGAGLLGWSDLTNAALDSVIKQLTIAPTAEEVTAELETIGFEFVDGRWVAVDIP